VQLERHLRGLDVAMMETGDRYLDRLEELPTPSWRGIGERSPVR
jgi:hypothetical protein